LSLEEEYPFLKDNRQLKEVFQILRTELQRHLRPANETILYDEHLMKILGVSKRKLEYMKSGREIPYYDPPMQRDYFILSEILQWLSKYRVAPIENRLAS